MQTWGPASGPKSPQELSNTGKHPANKRPRTGEGRDMGTVHCPHVDVKEFGTETRVSEEARKLGLKTGIVASRHSLRSDGNMGTRGTQE